MASFQITPPEQFDFSNTEGWTRWIRRFERYRITSKLATKDQETQVNQLIYLMGAEADDILPTFTLSEEEQTSYTIVKAKFDQYFSVRRNVIFERAKFNQRVQRDGEPVDSFITDLYSLAENCNYGALHDEMIRDRIVVGIRDLKLSEKLQHDSELTLQKAVTSARQSEIIHKQQPVIRGNVSLNTASGNSRVEELVTPKGKGKKPRGKTKPKTSPRPFFNNAKPKPTCSYCGRDSHPRAECPATRSTCRKCRKVGHWDVVCRSQRWGLSEIRLEQGSNNECTNEQEYAFLGSISADSESSDPSRPWLVNLEVNSRLVRDFKIDTGADVTVIPYDLYVSKPFPKLQQSGKRLYGPANSSLYVVGKFRAKLKTVYGDVVTEQNIYVARGLTRSLLGRPAIQALNLVSRIDSVVGDKWKDMFPKLFTGLGKMEGEYTIKLKEDAKPFSISTPRRVPLPLMKKVKQELQSMESSGVISKVDCPTDWCAGMVVVPKSSEKVRICVDLTKLNESVRREYHPLPAVDHTLSQLSGAKVFTKLDANSGFHQIPLSTDSSLLTCFITPFGRYCFNRLPFGISSAPEHFQKRMQQVLEGLDGVVCQMDDILIHGHDESEHDQHVAAALSRLRDAGITLNLEKCQFSKNKVKFLGHIIDSTGIYADPDKIHAITRMSEPQKVSDIRTFLGMVNQLAKFVPNLASKTQPLRELLVKDRAWVWEEPQRSAFQSIKDQLTSAPVLGHYDPNAETCVSADASSFGLGAVICQKDCSGVYKAVAYCSRSMTDTERRYAQVEKEALAITWACERFRDYLLGKQFHINTDHKPLLSLLGNKSLDQLPPRIQRFKMRLMAYSYTISHVPGKQLCSADALSRAPTDIPLSSQESCLLRDTNIYVDSVLATLPATDQRLDEIRLKLREDPKFSETYCFTHITSSPRYPQSNGEAERAVQTVKQLLKKSSDPYMALLTYRSTPLQNGFSPSQLLMGRNLRTTLPVHTSQLQANQPSSQEVKSSFTKIQQRQKSNYDSRHRSRILPQVKEGDTVLVNDSGFIREGQIHKEAETPRSFYIKAGDSILRRNRRHLTPVPGKQPTNTDARSQPLNVSSGVPSSVQRDIPPDVTLTRSGRVSVKPDRLDL
ncbi:uncharacterized protein LOC125371759 [Haliotis rufescens]|uniref:uncharacterized protein LOC125371759 n=1 Tax=Haliotis rufescens TaxID=6454 RepID=UPI00201E82F4|nr:uncharacterized protein LOC125371759 [Haliotis rufescens]